MPPLTRKEIVELLRLRDREQAWLFDRARAMRRQHFGDTAVVRGVIEVTSVCVQNCSYCPMRRDNRMTRYSYRTEEIVALSKDIRDAGIRVVSLQGGDTPRTTQIVGDAIGAIRAVFDGDVDILLVLGDKPRQDYVHLRDCGADSYILKHETSDAQQHLEHRYYPLAQRLANLEVLLALGYRVGTGTIVGLPGQTLEMLADDILLARSLGVHMCSASPFVPATDTPLADAPPGDIELTLNTLAAMRLVLPDALIPSVSALEHRSPGGQVAGFNAGANVVTVNFTPEPDRVNYPIYGADRFVVGRRHAAAVLQQAEMRSSLTPVNA